MEVVPKLEPEEAADACPQTPDSIASCPATRHSPSDGMAKNSGDENLFEEEGVQNSIEEKILPNDVTDMTSAEKKKIGHKTAKNVFYKNWSKYTALFCPVVTPRQTTFPFLCYAIY